MATDGIYEMDLSGTTVIDYSSVADSASAQIIRFSDPDLDFDESLSGITSVTPSPTTTARAGCASATTRRSSTASPSPPPTAATC